jgi:prepilin-type N-terminal cleavage/methylation domain-containing protein
MGWIREYIFDHSIIGFAKLKSNLMIKRTENEEGVTLIELLIVMAMSAVLLGATISIFVKQERTMRDQMSKTNLRALGRIAMEDMAKELRRAGYGFSGGLGITAMTLTSVDIRGNTDEVSSSLSADAAAATDHVDVFDYSNFTVGDNIVVYNPKDDVSEVQVMDTSTTTGKIDLVSNSLTNAYTVEDGTIVSQYHTVAYSFASGRITRTVDGTAIPMVGNVSNLAFTYRDSAGTVITPTNPATAAELASVRGIGIALTLSQTDGNSNIAVSLNTHVNLRNMD